MQIRIPFAVKRQGDKITIIKLPVEIWQHAPKWVFRYNSTSKIKQVVLDPDNQFPDTDRSNNIYEIK